MSERVWPAPAKLNLFLHITGRRPDGYHELQTVFQFLDLADQLRFTLRDDSEIIRHGGLPGLLAADDLVVRAARRLQAAADVRFGADITVEKHIPTGAGLGGGSSDAACALLVLNHLWGTVLPLARLAALGAELGADVPVFVYGQAAWAEGIGERLTPLPTLSEPWYAVVVPPCQVPTGALYQAPELTRNSSPCTITGFLAGAGTNVFQPVVRARYPLVGEALDWLGQHGTARLSGTGAAVFAAFKHEQAARQVLLGLPASWQGFVTRGCNQSPLHQVLQETV